MFILILVLSKCSSWSLYFQIWSILVFVLLKRDHFGPFTFHFYFILKGSKNDYFIGPKRTKVESISTKMNIVKLQGPK